MRLKCSAKEIGIWIGVASVMLFWLNQFVRVDDEGLVMYLVIKTIGGI